MQRINDFVIANGVLTKYTGSAPVVVIPEEVKEISDEVFKDCTFLEEIVFHDKVNIIGNRAFCGCTNLKKLSLPLFFVRIGEYAFCNTAIEKLVVPSYFGTVAMGAFSNCNSLVKVKIKYKHILFSDFVFSDCVNLKDVSLPRGMLRISKGMFKGCASLKSIHLPSKITSIGEAAFESCVSLKSVNCPKHLLQVADDAFANCPNFKKAQMLFGGNKYDIKKTFTINKNNVGEVVLEQFHSDNAEVCVIPDGVTRIAQGVFCNCDKLSDVIIPRSVKVIEEQAFYDCINLFRVCMDDGVEVIGDEAFKNCTTLFTVILGNSLKTIGKSAFMNCGYLSYIVLPNGLLTVDTQAFYGCKRIHQLTIPKSVTEIGSLAFSECSSDVADEMAIYSKTVEYVNCLIHSVCDKDAQDAHRYPAGQIDIFEDSVYLKKESIRREEYEIIVNEAREYSVRESGARCEIKRVIDYPLVQKDGHFYGVLVDYTAFGYPVDEHELVADEHGIFVLRLDDPKTGCICYQGGSDTRVYVQIEKSKGFYVKKQNTVFR